MKIETLEEKRKRWRESYYRRKLNPESSFKMRISQQKASEEKKRDPKFKEQQHQWYLKNKEKLNNKSRKYYLQHRERLLRKGRERWKEKYYSDPEFRKKRIEISKLNHRLFDLTINGKTVKVRKRIFYGTCKLCGETLDKNLQWHHWNHQFPEKGLWLSPCCYLFVEQAKKKRIHVPLYEKLKGLTEISVGGI